MYKNIKWKKNSTEKRGLRFDSHIGKSLTKQLGCTNFFKGIEYSIHEEIWIISHTIIKNEKNFEPKKAKEILDKLIKYNENENKLLLNFKYPKQATSHSESKTDKTDTLSSGNAGSSENNASINTIKIEKNDKKDNKQKNITTIESKKEQKKKKEKKKKKQLIPETEKKKNHLMK